MAWKIIKLIFKWLTRTKPASSSLFFEWRSRISRIIDSVLSTLVFVSSIQQRRVSSGCKLLSFPEIISFTVLSAFEEVVKQALHLFRNNFQIRIDQKNNFLSTYHYTGDPSSCNQRCKLLLFTLKNEYLKE